MQPGSTTAQPSDMAAEAHWIYRVPDATPEQTAFFYQLQGYVQKALRSLLIGRAACRVGDVRYLDIQGYRIEARLVLVDPPLAAQVGPATAIAASYAEPTEESQRQRRFLAAEISFPDEAYGDRYRALVGIDAIKDDLLAKLALYFSRHELVQWCMLTFGAIPPGYATLLNRYPFFLLAGEVGAGKTELAHTIGQPLALKLQRDVELLVLNTQVRGSGLVGELSSNISLAFDEAARRSQQRGIPVLLLIDEADSLAMTRGQAGMHHEDDAGVNTLIQRIDLLRSARNEVVVLFATNLGRALDPAITRRAAAAYHFRRPDEAIRRRIFQTFLAESGLRAAEIDALVHLTAPRPIPGQDERRPHAYTHSDLAQRIIPTAFEQGFLARESGQTLMDQLLRAIHTIHPTPEFNRAGPAAGAAKEPL